MTLRPVEFVSYADATGYGQAAVGYVRLLVDAGVPVHWVPLRNADIWAGRLGPRAGAAERAAGRACVLQRAQAQGTLDLAGLVAATAQPLPASSPEPIRVLHLLPCFWQAEMAAAPQALHVGLTVWETDRMTAAWLPALAAVQALIVPCQHNAQVLQAAQAETQTQTLMQMQTQKQTQTQTQTQTSSLPPVHVVPHVRRDMPAPPPARLQRMRRHLGVREGDTVFLSINAWAPRKRMAQLVEGWARHFSADDPALLVIKSGRQALFDDPAAPPGDRDVARTLQAILARGQAATGRPPGRVAWITEDEVADHVIDTLHHLSHAHVSFSRCEGFGLGQFDAAALGRPVFAVGYGGPLDFLGHDWPGRIPHTLVPSEAVPGFGWFDASQSWPQPDDDAALRAMSAFLRAPQPFLDAAQRQAAAIAATFNAQAVAPRLLAALGLGAR